MQASPTVDTKRKADQVCRTTSECLHVLSNEPSLGLFYVQEHLRRSISELAQVKVSHRRGSHFFKPNTRCAHSILAKN